MIVVMMVYKTGGDYTPVDVARLAGGIRRNLTVPHKIVCMTDDTPNVSKIVELDGMMTLNHDLPGWWSKMELFKVHGPILYFDLDTVIIGNIDALANHIISMPDMELVMLQDFYRGSQASGIMGWSGDMTRVFDIYLKKSIFVGQFVDRGGHIAMKVRNTSYRGDQEWLCAMLPNVHPKIDVTLAQDIHRGIYSYKVDMKNGTTLNHPANIVCFHGKPRPHEVKPIPDWMKGYWHA